MSEEKKTIELNDEELDKVAGGQNSTYCICDRFVPEDGNWNNKTYSNCYYGLSAAKHSALCPGNPNKDTNAFWKFFISCAITNIMYST